MAAEKQIDAAQKFLRGIQSLASYEEVRDKQAQGVQRSLEKVVSFTAAQAAFWLGLLQADLWTVAFDTFREVVAAKTRPVEVESNRDGVTQDFSLLPCYLSDDLAQDVGMPQLIRIACYADCVSMRQNLRCTMHQKPQRQQSWCQMEYVQAGLVAEATARDSTRCFAASSLL